MEEVISRSANWLQLVSAALLTLIVTVSYHQVADHRFVWDTIPFVLENPWLQQPGFEEFRSMFLEAHRANWQPLVWLSHSLDFYLFGMDSGAHHLVNLAMHLVNVVLVMLLVQKLLAVAGVLENHRVWVGFCTALTFGIHPQHVESVAWVVERKDVLYAIFTLVCFRAYLVQHAEKRRNFAFVWFCLAIMSKPMAITLPAVLILMDYYPLRRFELTLNDIVKAFTEKWHYLFVSLIVLIITLNTQSIAMVSVTDLPIWARLLNALDNTWFYVAHYIWPVKLSPLYPYPQGELILSWKFWLPGGVFFIGMFVAGGLCLLKGYRWPLMLWLFYLATLLPVSGVVHVGPAKATDHYVYLATLPLGLITALLLSYLINRFERLRSLTISAAIAYFLFLALMTHQQVKYWNNPLTLWTRVVQLHPDSALGHRNLSTAYLQIGESKSALYHAEKSLQLGGPVAQDVRELREAIERDSQQ